MPSPDASGKLKQESSGSDLTLGLSLLIVGGVFALSTQSIQELGFADEHDPGPQALPLVLAGLLIVSGAGYVTRSCFHRVRQHSSQAAEAAPTQVRSAWASIGVITLLSLLIAYVVAIPWLGFSLATLVFATATAMAFGARWWVSLLAAVGMVVTIQLLFVHGFDVILPRGYLLEQLLG